MIEVNEKASKIAKESYKDLLNFAFSKKIEVPTISNFTKLKVDRTRWLKNEFKKENNLYNENHVDKKYEKNQAFLDLIQPESICDAFCGVISPYKNIFKTNAKEILTNDANPHPADYNMDANDFMQMLIDQGKTYDLVDIDPWNSPIEFIDNGIKLAKKAICITYGEFGNMKRTKKVNYIKRAYNLSLEEYTIDNIILWTKLKALKHGKTIELIDLLKTKGSVFRAYYSVEGKNEKRF